MNDVHEELTAAGLPAAEIEAAVLRALDEDRPAGGPGDVTSVATIPADQHGTATIGAREAGVLAGGAVAELVFRTVIGDDVVVSERLPDGSALAPGDVVLRVEGPVRGLLTAERTALNFLSHLSGVASATAQWVRALDGTRARVLDTRKTLPGWRALQKYAVRCGGGLNHRTSLSDMALVKDNHVVAAGGVVAAYDAVRRAYPDIPVEVEVDDLDGLRALLEAGCDRILLDNMSVADMTEAVRLAAGRASLEASGGLTLDRAREVAATGVDFISTGALTHSVRVLDLGLDLS
ncbi:nicotinate-nucleotide diphosphorylase (carboxylating) [Marmoricola endophyticus]|uniref:Nicotinate-nucleotide pyrophosphorylase [carboxylating] n=1 Tax=Marmoricola endophyticus TaxID=2040280 RepID=A0A917BJ40_9ACTN|nr:carboxylating nicotinate-nucleotide diphosphorylase [Marmoricola endophyticus]GGF44994.1 nicotinate-nucleotide diphosphorylase (carboxylating) [Marmoricola endophyticus]